MSKSPKDTKEILQNDRDNAVVRDTKQKEKLVRIYSEKIKGKR